MLRVFLFLIIAFSLFSCKQDTGIDLSDYYYPLDEIGESAIYVYQPVVDSLAGPVEWRYSLVQKGEKTMLRGENLDFLGRPIQIHEEEIIRSGAVLRSLTLMDYDSSGVETKSFAEIEGNNLFPFYVIDSTLVYFYKVNWDQQNDSLKVALTRNRRYMGKTEYTIGSQSFKCVKFQLRELLTTDRVGMTKSQWSGIEIYAKGIGLVYYKKEISPSYILEYQLEKNPFETN